MTKTKKPRVTKQLPIEERLNLWKSGECPYCGAKKVEDKEVVKTKRGKIRGLHFTCQNRECNAENFFSNKRLVGGEP